ncbi:hypothetical protein LTR37_000879 [Vermiconidia calcicola]|uniref:Uncharacterized protein n=1 Tax=Vermiconidia calcicola TaxID=1690605 RepID=A0ACC3NXP9_9PEZI|nr:hypothetical protein LTR37_000879 [Vermiconidia calcicola]
MIRLKVSQATLASQHDSFVDDFYKTKFMSKEYTKLEKLQLERLTNDIHPLFYEPLANATPDYGVVEQSARLATQLIDTGPLDNLFRTMIDNPTFHKWTDGDDPSKNGVEYSEQEVDPRVPLRSMTTTVCKNGSESWPAQSSMLWMVKMVTTITTLPLSNSEMRMSLIRRAPADIEALYISPGRCMFEFAVTLVHEACHALRNFINGKIDHEPFFGNEIVAEVGFAAEARLWGGHLSRLYNQPHAYDHSQYVCLYKHDGPTHAIADAYPNNFRVDRKQMRPLDVAWRVPITWFTNLFTDNFWDDLMTVIGGGLRPPLTTGYCFRFDPTAGHVPVKRSEQEAQYIPKGFQRIRPGDIVRGGTSKRRRPSLEDDSMTSVLFREKRPRLWLTEVETEEEIYYMSEWSVSEEASDEVAESSSGYTESEQALDVEMHM